MSRLYGSPNFEIEKTDRVVNVHIGKASDGRDVWLVVVQLNGAVGIHLTCQRLHLVPDEVPSSSTPVEETGDKGSQDVTQESKKKGKRKKEDYPQIDFEAD